MAVIGPTIIHEMTGAAPIRLGGGLAVGAALAQGNTYRERIQIPTGCVSVSLRFKMTVTGGTPTAQIVPQTANIRPPDLAVSSVTTGLTAATNVVTATELLHTYTCLGDEIVDVVIDTTGASAAGTIVYADVYTKLA